MSFKYKNGQVFPLYTLEQDHYITKMRVNDCMDEIFAQKGKWTRIEKDDFQIQVAGIPEKFTDEKQIIFFMNELSKDIFFLNRTLVDPGLNF